MYRILILLSGSDVDKAAFYKHITMTNDRIKSIEDTD